jgi:hypothetical protein
VRINEKVPERVHIDGIAIMKIFPSLHSAIYQRFIPILFDTECAGKSTTETYHSRNATNKGTFLSVTTQREI